MSCLFLAEPHGVPRQLLPHGLQQLLHIAQDESLQEPWPRVGGTRAQLQSVVDTFHMKLMPCRSGMFAGTRGRCEVTQV